MIDDVIRIAGARENNLKNLSVTIPKNKLVVVTGISGSGKSSLAFDTLFAEGQRRYVESLSAYARQFLGQLRHPDVDLIDGLSPAVAIDQRGLSTNPRSTVGTITEIFDYLRLLYARAGIPHCPICGREVQKQSAQEIAAAMAAHPPEPAGLLLAPMVRARKGVHQAAIEEMRRSGFVRMRVDGRLYETDAELDAGPSAPRHRSGDRPAGDPREWRRGFSLPADRFGRDGAARRRRVPHRPESIGAEPPEDSLFSERYACPVDGISLPDIQPNSFSFNSPARRLPRLPGPRCAPGDRPRPASSRTPRSRSKKPCFPCSPSRARKASASQSLWLESIAAHYGFDPETPIGQILAEFRKVLYGTGAEKIRVEFPGREGAKANLNLPMKA